MSSHSRQSSTSHRSSSGSSSARSAKSSSGTPWRTSSSSFIAGIGADSGRGLRVLGTALIEAGAYMTLGYDVAKKKRFFKKGDFSDDLLTLKMCRETLELTEEERYQRPFIRKRAMKIIKGQVAQNRTEMLIEALEEWIPGRSKPKAKTSCGFGPVPGGIHGFYLFIYDITRITRIQDARPLHDVLSVAGLEDIRYTVRGLLDYWDDSILNPEKRAKILADDVDHYGEPLPQQPTIIVTAE